MKKWARYVALVLALVLSFSLLGCSLLGGAGSDSGDRGRNSANNSSGGSSNSSSESDVSAKLVGTWVEVDVDNKYVFKADGTGSEFLFSFEYKMKSWKIDGDQLIMDFVDTGIEKYTFSLDGNTLKVDDGAGTIFEYKRQ